MMLIISLFFYWFLFLLSIPFLSVFLQKKDEPILFEEKSMKNLCKVEYKLHKHTHKK